MADDIIVLSLEDNNSSLWLPAMSSLSKDCNLRLAAVV